MADQAKLVFWTAAWLNMAAIAWLALSGVRRARRREIAAHRRRMLTAAWLVAFFLISYVVKLALLGREELERWDHVYVDVLRLHELCVAVMVAAGLTTIGLAMRLGLARAPDGSQGAYDPAQVPSRLRWHRAAGRTAVAAALAGFLSAAFVLFGMYARAGWV